MKIINLQMCKYNSMNHRYISMQSLMKKSDDDDFAFGGVREAPHKTKPNMLQIQTQIQIQMVLFSTRANY